MGMIAAFVTLGLIATGLYHLATKTDARQKFGAEFAANPFLACIGMIGAAGFVACFVGLLVPSLGTIRIWFGRSSLEVWQLGGICFLAATIAVSFLHTDR